jgi:hypothetical protein
VDSFAGGNGDDRDEFNAPFPLLSPVKRFLCELGALAGDKSEFGVEFTGIKAPRKKH